VADDFYSFNEALEQLRLKEEELKRLVSEGEIRAFRDGDTMQLRRQDVENLRTELMGGEVVDLGGGGEDLVFEDDSDLGDAGMATEEISEVDTLLEEDVEDVGEIDLEEEIETTAPVRRTSAIAAAQAVEEEAEGMGMRAVMIITSMVLLLGLPITISISTGHASEIAKTIASIFGATIGE
jgi:excisionase family DNA binding protein